MSAEAASGPRGKRSMGLWSMLLRAPLAMIALGALFFIPAGTLRWLMGWLVIALHVVYFMVLVPLLVRASPDLIPERTKLITSDTKGWDKWLTPLMGVVLLAGMVVAGLDHRFGWTQIPVWLQWVGLAVTGVGYSLFGWAMLVNRYFSRVVRIQDDRGHQVVSSGPYSMVRHPGYAGFIPAFLGLGLALGSVWGLALMALSGAMLIARTALEDRTLRAELPGYADYAKRVRYRLLPGIW